MPSRLLRWLPAVLAPAAVAAAAVTVPLSAGAAGSLPEKSPEQVLELAAKSASMPGFSGTVRQTSDLGLPQLPAGLASGSGSASSGDESSANAVELLTGSHTARVYESGRDERRVQVLDSMGERDVVRKGSDVWFWDAKHDTATHVTVPQRTADSSDVVSPADAARRALAAIDDSTAVAVDGSANVAGHDAYRLVLTPKSSGTTVGSVAIAVEAETGLPLQVQVTPRGATAPAFSVEFTDVDLSAPADSLFDFQPPAGATVKQQTLPTRDSSADSGKRPAVTGTGWDAVVTIDAGAQATAGITSDAVVQQLTKPAAGGRVLSTTLVNVLLTDDGRVLAGAVPVSRLEAVAAG